MAHENKGKRKILALPDGAFVTFCFAFHLGRKPPQALFGRREAANKKYAILQNRCSSLLRGSAGALLS